MTGLAGLAELEAALRAALRDELDQRFDELHKMLERRLREISVEVNAAVQALDLNESSLSQQLAEMRNTITSLVDSDPTAAETNSGAELEAVVQLTESAADAILGAAE